MNYLVPLLFLLLVACGGNKDDTILTGASGWIVWPIIVLAVLVLGGYLIGRIRKR